MGIFTDDIYIEKYEHENCPCCKCDAHWSTCRYCKYYESKQHDRHVKYH